MSTSTRKRRATDEILESLDDLVRARPHLHKTARFRTDELRVYQTGYYWGVTMALRVTLEAIDRFEATRKYLRATSRQKRSA